MKRFLEWTKENYPEDKVLLEKWAKDVKVKNTGENTDKSKGKLKKEIKDIEGKKGNKKEMGKLLFALRAKQGWKKGKGATGLDKKKDSKKEDKKEDKKKD